jgi:tRNA dimethylallyltransferase
MTGKPVLVILGPTASGKSELAYRVALESGAEIISADSRQIYRRMDIGTAKPTPHMLERVKHHFIDEREIGSPFSSGDFASEATERILSIRSRGIPAIVAGGSTLYIEGLLKGFSPLPPSDPEIRTRLQHELDRSGPEALYRRLEAIDPEQARTLDPTKTHRLVRSLEIIEISGSTVTSLQQTVKEESHGVEFTVIGLQMPRPLLYEKINLRTAGMMRAGLAEEAEALYKEYRLQINSRSLGALMTVGYQELFDCFGRNTAIEAAAGLIAQHTRNYAKRQLTFFKNRLNVEWVDSPLNEAGMAELIDSLCRRIS